MYKALRYSLCLAAVAMLAPGVDFGSPGHGVRPLLAQGPVPVTDRQITYILPQWNNFFSATDAEFAAEVQQLRARIGEGPRVRVGFTTYVSIVMSDWSVDITNPA